MTPIYECGMGQHDFTISFNTLTETHASLRLAYKSISQDAGRVSKSDTSVVVEKVQPCNIIVRIASIYE